MPEDVATVRSSELLAKLELEYLNLILRERRLSWFGHVERSSGAVRTACDIQIVGRRGAERPKLTWRKLTEKDCREWKHTTVDPQERSTWRSGVRFAMCAATPLPGRGPTEMLLHLHVNKKSDYDMMICMTSLYQPWTVIYLFVLLYAYGISSTKLHYLLTNKPGTDPGILDRGFKFTKRVRFVNFTRPRGYKKKLCSTEHEISAANKS